MAERERTKLETILVVALGQRRTQLAAEIDKINTVRLADLTVELDEVESKLKEIDPGILTLAEEKALAEDEARRREIEAATAAGEVEDIVLSDDDEKSQ